MKTKKEIAHRRIGTPNSGTSPRHATNLESRWIPPSSCAHKTSTNHGPPAHAIFKSKANSSKRTCAGHVAHEFFHSHMSSKKRAKHRGRANAKDRKLNECLLNVSSPLGTHFWSRAELDCTELVFDGGDEHTAPLECPSLIKTHRPKTKVNHSAQNTVKPKKIKPPKPWKSIRVSDGDLYIVDTKISNKGLVFRYDNGGSAFTRVPRQAALEMTGMNKLSTVTSHCHALDLAEKAQRGSLFRSKNKVIYSTNKHVCPGAQACRAEPGVRDNTYHKKTMPEPDWINLVKTLCNVEKVVSSFVPTEDLRRVNMAKTVLDYKTMTATKGGNIVLESHIFNAIGYTKNVHVSCHTDVDFTQSVITCYKKGHVCECNDNVVAYFCFPRIGMAVALRPGDILVFNPREYHSVSSRCTLDYDIYFTSMYLKSAVVSLNDNTIPLTSIQEKCFTYYEKNLN